MDLLCLVLLVAGAGAIIAGHLLHTTWIGIVGGLAILAYLFLDCERQKRCRR